MRALLLVPLLLTACVDIRAQRQAALSTTIGMDEATLVRAVGVPTRVADVGGHRFLAYADHRVDVSPGFGGGFGGFGGFGPYGGFGPFGFYDAGFPIPIERSCETTFELASGRVASWTERGRACGTEATGTGVPVLAPP